MRPVRFVAKLVAISIGAAILTVLTVFLVIGWVFFDAVT